MPNEITIVYTATVLKFRYKYPEYAIHCDFGQPETTFKRVVKLIIDGASFLVIYNPDPDIESCIRLLAKTFNYDILSEG